MSDEVESMPNGLTTDLELVYVHMPQNDLEQIKQVVREYESEPAKGLAHGVQKDAIQNGFGARVVSSEVKACEKTWKFYFELTAIKGEESLVFWDEGTFGLTGDILPIEEIEKRSAEGLLGSENANQRLARFLTRFESGGNLGPGSFGRGKLIFQGASKSHSILVDSLRADDKKYIAFDRKIIGNQLKQPSIPLEGNRAEQFIHDATSGHLKPLTTPGTRITILKVNEEISTAFKKSFTDEIDSDGYSEIFSRMIEETWWEIIQFGAKIFLRWKGKDRRISISEPLRSILECKNKEKSFKVYSKNNISVIVDDSVFKIKHLKFVVAPNPIDDDLREIWVQRKRMKIGNIAKGIFPHHKIQKHFSGYIILDPDLEKLFEEKESPTHYGFITKGRAGGAVSEVRSIVRSHLEAFQQEIGIRVQSSESLARQDMLETLKELNEQASKLGLITEFSIGTPKNDVEISIESFTLPNPTTTRVEIGDIIGPIVYRVKNNTIQPQLVKIMVVAEQRGRVSNDLLQIDLDLKANGYEIVNLPTFKLSPTKFANGESLLLRAQVISRHSSEILYQVTRMLWIGIDPPTKPQDLVDVTIYEPNFPRPQTRRVELNEKIGNIHFKLSNKISQDLKLKFDLVVRKAKSPTQAVRVLKILVAENSFQLPSFSEREFTVPALSISKEVFGSIFEESADPRERKCELFVSVRAAENYPKFEKNIRDHVAAKKAIAFYCGADPAGMSVFKNLDEKDEPDDGKRTWVEGDRASGYTFVLNIGHSSYKLTGDDEEFRKYYIREQMLFQAYLIAVKEKVFKGPAENFAEIFSDNNIEPVDASRYIDEIVGIALNQVG